MTTKELKKQLNSLPDIDEPSKLAKNLDYKLKAIGIAGKRVRAYLDYFKSKGIGKPLLGVKKFMKGIQKDLRTKKSNLKASAKTEAKIKVKFYLAFIEDTIKKIREYKSCKDKKRKDRLRIILKSRKIIK